MNTTMSLHCLFYLSLQKIETIKCHRPSQTHYIQEVTNSILDFTLKFEYRLKEYKSDNMFGETKALQV